MTIESAFGSGASRPEERRHLLIVFAAALAVRGAYLFFYRNSPLFDVYYCDQTYYRYWAQQIAGGDWLGSGIFEQGPLYAYLLGLVYRLFGTGESLVLFLQLLSGLVTVALVWWCAGTLFGRRAALAAGLLAAAYGPLVYYECMLMKTFLEPLLSLAVLAAALKGLGTGRRRWFAAAGAGVGLLFLVREIHALLLAPLFMAIFLLSPRGERLARKNFLAGALLLGAFLLALSPSAARNLAVGKEFVASTTGGGEAFYMAYGPYADGYCTQPYFVGPHPFQEHQDFRREAFFRTLSPMSRKEASGFWYGEGIKEILKDMGRLPGLVVKRALIFFDDGEVPDSDIYPVAAGFMPYLSFLPTFAWIAGLGLLGACLGWKREGAARLALWLAAALAAEVLLTYNYGRFRIAFCGVWLIFAGAGLEWLIRSSGKIGKGAGYIAALVSVLSISALSFNGTAPPRERAEEDEISYRNTMLNQAQKRDEAVALEAALPYNGQNADVLFSLGAALWISGKYQEAVESYRETVRLNPPDARAHMELALICRNFGRFGEAAAHADAVTELLPAYGEGFHAAGLIALDQGMETGDEASRRSHFERAWLFLERATLLSPDNPLYHYHLGRASYFLGDLPRATAELSLASKIDPLLASAGEDLKFIGQKAKSR